MIRSLNKRIFSKPRLPNPVLPFEGDKIAEFILEKIMNRSNYQTTTRLELARKIEQTVDAYARKRVRAVEEQNKYNLLTKVEIRVKMLDLDYTVPVRLKRGQPE